jgi:hypothetical protein
MSEVVFFNFQLPDCVTLGIKLMSSVVYMPYFVKLVSVTWSLSLPSSPVHLAPDVTHLSFPT